MMKSLQNLTQFLLACAVAIIPYFELEPEKAIAFKWNDHKALASSVNANVDSIWGDEERDYWIRSINKSFTSPKKDPYVLYNVQTTWQNLLTYSNNTNNTRQLERIADVILATYNHLQKTSEIVHYWPVKTGYPNDRMTMTPLTNPSLMWVEEDTSVPGIKSEDILSSSQFLYFVSDYINITSDIEANKRTTKMKEVIDKFTPVIVQDHYMRWISDDKDLFQVKGWGCEKYTSPNYNGYDFLVKKLDKSFGADNADAPLYCNAVNDVDMWIIAGAAEIIGASGKNPQVILSDHQKEVLMKYISLGSRLIESRLSESNLTDFHGNSVIGLNFDLGMHFQHPDYAYAGYSGDAFPQETDKKPSVNVGSDLSHARRFVNVFDALNTNRLYTKQSFPDNNVLKKLANQIIYGSFNKDLNKPLFSNFMDGTNGWYRVNYSNRIGFGYAPYDMSVEFATGGYGFWAKYNSDIDSVMQSLLKLFYSSDQDLIKFRQDHYETSHYGNGVRSGSSLDAILASFLPTLASDALETSLFTYSNKDEIKKGEIITYTISFTNSNKEAVNNIEVSNGIPAKTSYIMGSATAGGQLSGGTLKWKIPHLQPGEEFATSFKVKVNN